MNFLDNKTKEYLKKNIISKLNSNYNVWEKENKSFVTDIDLYISNLIKDLFKDSSYNFYSEEDFTQLEFPTVILDPIDGTAGLVRGTHECCVSLAICKDPSLENYAWIFNPFTGLEISSDSKSVITKKNMVSHKKTLLGYVSRSEWNEGLHDYSLDNIVTYPMGSIALKLGLLSVKSCDFIVSFKEKNVWDIAAGTILCAQENINFYSDGKLITSLNQKKYRPPLIWCSEELWGKISTSFL